MPKAKAKKSAGKRDRSAENAKRRAARKARKANESQEETHVPDEALIHPHPPQEQGKITDSAEVHGDKTLQVIDVRSSRPVDIYVVDAVSFDPARDPRLVFVEGPVQSEVLSAERTRAKFAQKPDGTVIYNHGGFDDVPNPEFPLVNILKLIELKGKKKGKK